MAHAHEAMPHSAALVPWLRPALRRKAIQALGDRAQHRRLHKLQSSGSAACRRRPCNHPKQRAPSPALHSHKSKPALRDVCHAMNHRHVHQHNQVQLSAVTQPPGMTIWAAAPSVQPLIDATSMPTVTKLAPSPSCDGRRAPGAQLSFDHARSFRTLAPSSAPGPHPSCIHSGRAVACTAPRLARTPSLARTTAAHEVASSRYTFWSAAVCQPRMRWRPHYTRFGAQPKARATPSSHEQGSRPSAARDDAGFAERRGTGRARQPTCHIGDSRLTRAKVTVDTSNLFACI